MYPRCRALAEVSCLSNPNEEFLMQGTTHVKARNSSSDCFPLGRTELSSNSGVFTAKTMLSTTLGTYNHITVFRCWGEHKALQTNK